jgi:phosphatidylethanolamine/phosphatidyl-N-methylethanolamine N-methyltransferase
MTLSRMKAGGLANLCSTQADHRGGMRSRELDVTTVRKAYKRWAPVYDLVFGAIFNRGRSAAVAAAERIGGRVLEVGVGTGISLPAYSARSRIIGIDLSEAMLRKARRRVRTSALRNVERLDVMDAENLSFPDASFDVVVAQYVVSTVPHPEIALDELARTLRPGGEIVILTRLGAEAGLRRTAERLLQPVVRRLGWRTDFPWDRFGRWIGQRADLRLVERRAMPPLGHFSLIRIRKAEAPARQHDTGSA